MSTHYYLVCLDTMQSVEVAASIGGMDGGSVWATLTAVLRRLKRGDITVHGFCSTFRDWCAESAANSFPREVCEHALAHSLPEQVGRHTGATT